MDLHEEHFVETKKIITKEILLVHADFNKEFTIHADTSAIQLGSVMLQEGKLLVFYSRKLSQTQILCTATNKELLSIAELVKESRAMLLGHKIIACRDHLYLLCVSTASLERV